MRGDLPGNKPSQSLNDWVSVAFIDAGSAPTPFHKSRNSRVFRWILDESMPLLWLETPSALSGDTWFVYNPFFLRMEEFRSWPDILETFSHVYRQHSRIRFQDLEWVWVPSSQKEPPEGFEDAFLYQKGDDFVWISDKEMPQPRYYHKDKARCLTTDCLVLEDVLLWIDFQEKTEATINKHFPCFAPITTELATVGPWWTAI